MRRAARRRSPAARTARQARLRGADDGWEQLVLGVSTEVNPFSLGARALLLLGLGLWTLGFLRHGMAAGYLMGSFMHLIHLPFHEAGHIFLMPFGRFLTTLGGSLFQVAVPLLCSVVFLWKTRDPFAAAVALWWAGQSFLDLAPYIADARALRLPLLGGRTGAEVEGHDWEYLLQTMGWLMHDVTLGRLSFAFGALLMVAALVWAGQVLRRQYRALARR
jgi:hypothetical protein